MASPGRARQRLLFVAPVAPADSGNGLAMRAGLFLDALSHAFEVVLLVVPVAGPDDPSASDFVARRAARTIVAPLADHIDPHYRLILRLKDTDERRRALADYPHPLLARFATQAAARAAAGLAGAEGFDLVHVMRLYLAPFIRPFLAEHAARPLAIIDLDDDEVDAHARLAALHGELGDRGAMAVESADSAKYARFEREWLPRFDGVIVGSARDREALERRAGPLPVDVVPNAVRIRGPAAPAPREQGLARLLFVGTLGYLPNEDAVVRLADDILPRVRALSGLRVELDVVGRGPSARVRRLAERDGVRVHADVADVAPFYAAADLVVIPIRAGAGTRIKLLEALAAGVPAVSSTLGAEGLDVEPGREILVADDPWRMAEACAGILRDPELGRALSARGARFVAARHDWEGVSNGIRALFGRALERSEASRVDG